MSEQTPKANSLLVEFQNYIADGYEATNEEWAAFGRKAVDALYETERAISALENEMETMTDAAQECAEAYHSASGFGPCSRLEKLLGGPTGEGR